MIRFVPVLLLVSSLATAAETPPVKGQVTFLYFADLERADAFYGETLGLTKEFDLDWVKIYKISPTSSVGLVNASGGAHQPSSEKPVMVSMVVEVDAVDAWWQYLKDKGVDVGDPPKTGADGNVKAFGFKDPEGYTLEVFAWTR